MAKNRPIDVETGTWKREPKEVILRASAISTGVAVAVSNLVTGTGYLGVFTSDSILQFQGMVRTALNERGAPGALLVWYCGAALVRPDYPAAREINTETTALRRIVEQAFEGKSVRTMYGNWLPVGMYVNMSLRCGTDRAALVLGDDPIH